jgi:methionine synthase I (cobalamin-dependent)
MKFLDDLGKKILLFDGAMGTMLQAKGTWCR